jgi:hypothetical protein
MKCSHFLLLAIVAALSGCSVEHGVVDYANPMFDVNFGHYSTLMFFPDGTVLRMGSSYYILNLPFYVLVVLSALAILGSAWFGYRRYKHRKAR